MRVLVAAALLALASTAHGMELAVAEGVFHDRPRGDPMRSLAFDRAKQLGATHIRASVIWEKAAAYDDAWFGRWDSFVDECVARGFKVQLTLTGIASQQYGGANRLGINPDPQAFAAFAELCARRWAGKVQRFSFWNEPNYLVFLLVAPKPIHDRLKALAKQANDATLPKAKRLEAGRKRRDLIAREVLPRNARRYRELHRLAAARIRAVIPGVQILAGELAQKGAFEFLELLAPKGQKWAVDGFALHPYQFTTAPDSAAGKKLPTGGISRVPDFKKALARLAAENRLRTRQGEVVPLYLTEFGYMKLEDRGGFKIAGQIPEARRAAWLPGAYEIARKAGVRQMLYFNLVPTPAGYPWDTSLLDRAGNPLPSFEALERWARQHGY